MMPSWRASALALWITLAPACGGGDDDHQLVLFHTNDEHSHLLGFSPEIDDYPDPAETRDGSIVGGILRRAAVLEAERAALDDGGVDHLTVSAGDETQGALPQIAFATLSPDFQMMARLGYDVMCPGNHEFDRGPDAFAASIEAARDGDGMPHLVSSNIRFSDEDGDDALEALYGEDGSTAAITPTHVVTTASGLKVGFIGIMGVSASFYAPLKTPVRFSADPDDEGDQATVLPQLYADLEPAVAALRDDQGVDVVVALSHSGVNTDQPELGDDYQIAANVPGIDLIVSGHSHTPLEEPMLVEAPDGYVVPIVQAGSFGRWLGRVEIVVPDGARPELVDDGEATRLIPIDDRTAPIETGDLAAALMDVLFYVEENGLAEQISHVEGEEVTDAPSVLGDLYYRKMGETAFDVIGTRPSVETNMLNLSTDAMLTTAEDLAGPTVAAVQASGNVRDDIITGQTGALAYSDLYRVLPLGVNPLDGSIGYPLTRFYIYTVELKAAFEVGVSRGYVEDSLFLSAAGVRVEYDTSREPQVLDSEVAALDPHNGRVTRILVDVDHTDGYDNPTVALFDIDRTGAEWESELGDEFALQPVVTSLYIASFADAAGVTLKDSDGVTVDLLETILRRPDDSDVKDFEAFIGYIGRICADNGGLLPSRYDETDAAGEIPRRMICTGPLCRD